MRYALPLGPSLPARKAHERESHKVEQEDAAATCHISLSRNRIPLFERPVQEPEPEELNSATHEVDSEAGLPNYPDHPSPSAPIAAPANQDGFDAPPSYDAAMRGES